MEIGWVLIQQKELGISMGIDPVQQIWISNRLANISYLDGCWSTTTTIEFGLALTPSHKYKIRMGIEPQQQHQQP